VDVAVGNGDNKGIYVGIREAFWPRVGHQAWVDVKNPHFLFWKTIQYIWRIELYSI